MSKYLDLKHNQKYHAINHLILCLITAYEPIQVFNMFDLICNTIHAMCLAILSNKTIFYTSKQHSSALFLYCFKDYENVKMFVIVDELNLIYLL